MANGLNPTYQALYDAQLPQLDLASQQANQARGMFYSGNAVDAQTKARADLLAKLLAQQAGDTQAQTLQSNQIASDKSTQEAQAKAASRATNMGLIGTGVGTAATLYGMHLMNKGGIKNMFQSGGNTYTIGADGKATLVDLPGSAAAPGVGGAALSGGAPAATIGLDSLAGTGPGFNAPLGANGLGGTNTPGGIDPFAGTVNPASIASPAVAGAAPVAAVAPAVSMWNNPLQAAEGAGMGLAGGAGGYLAARRINGGGKNTALGSGIGGGLGALIGGGLMTSGNPYAAGAGALLGSLGGGLLGNLFK